MEKILISAADITHAVLLVSCVLGKDCFGFLYLAVSVIMF
jgi:hypothetical protein